MDSWYRYFAISGIYKKHCRHRPWETLNRYRVSGKRNVNKYQPCISFITTISVTLQWRHMSVKAYQTTGNSIVIMMTSSNGKIFRVTGHLCGEFTGNIPGEFPDKGQWRGALMFSLICVWINDWVNNREAGDLRRYRGHYDVYVMFSNFFGYDIIKISNIRIIDSFVWGIHQCLMDFLHRGSVAHAKMFLCHGINMNLKASTMLFHWKCWRYQNLK